VMRCWCLLMAEQSHLLPDSKTRQLVYYQ